jgi:hypothetical protein
VKVLHQPQQFERPPSWNVGILGIHQDFTHSFRKQRQAKFSSSG